MVAHNFYPVLVALDDFVRAFLQQMIMDLVWEEMEASVGVMQFMIPDQVCGRREQDKRDTDKFRFRVRACVPSILCLLLCAWAAVHP